jgi:hypothetical protein
MDDGAGFGRHFGVGVTGVFSGIKSINKCNQWGQIGLIFN